MALDDIAKKDLQQALRNIDPTRQDIIAMMTEAFEQWVKHAEVEIRIPSGIPVQVDTRTGKGYTTETTIIRVEIK